MAASDLQTASAAERQRLLRALFTVPASATATECRDPKVLEATVQDAVSDLTYSSFGSVNPHAQHVKATGVATLLSRHAQTSKLNAFNKLKSEYVSPSCLHLPDERNVARVRSGLQFRSVPIFSPQTGSSKH